MSSAFGRLGLQLAGTLIGASFGFPGLGTFIGTLAGSIFFPIEVPPGPRLSDLSVTTASYGKPIFILLGTHRLGGTAVWSPGLKEHTVEAEVGGKGGPTQTIFVYTVSFRVNLCEGPADAILRIWADGDLIFDVTGTGPVEDIFSGNPGNPAIRIYLGTETQEPDPAEQADKGIADTPAYRGVVGIVFQDYLEQRIPQITAEVAMSASETFPVTTIGPLTALGTKWEWHNNFEKFVSNAIQRIDNLNQSLIGTITLTGDQTLQPKWVNPDANGNVYRAQEGFGEPGNARVFKYDGVGLGLITTGSDMKDPFTLAAIESSINWTGSRIFGGVPLPDGTLTNEFLYMNRGTTGVVVVVDIDNLNSSTGGTVNFYDIGNTLTDGETVDTDRNLWVFANVAGDTILYKIESVTGNNTASFTLSGVVTSEDCISYEPVTNSLILAEMTGVSGTSSMRRWSLDTNIVEAELASISLSNKADANSSMFRNGPSPEGRMYLQNADASGNFTEYDVINMVEGRSWDINTDFGLDQFSISWGIYDPLRRAVIKRKTDKTVYWLHLDRQTSNLITVRSVVEAYSARVDLIAGVDINATALTSTFNSHVVDRRMSASAALEPLLPTFQFVPRESDFLIEYVNRGGSSGALISTGDMAARTDDPRKSVVELEDTIIQEIELPQVLDLGYADPDADYQANVQTSKLPATTTNTKRRLAVTFPGALNNDLAAQSVQKQHAAIIANRRSVSFSVSQKHLLSDPADIVTIVEAGELGELLLQDEAGSLLLEDGSGVLLLENPSGFDAELAKADIGADNSIKMLGVLDQTSAFTSTVTGSSGGVPPQTITLTALSEFFIMDTSLFRDVDDGFGLYGAMGANNSLAGWPGGEIRRGTDAITFPSLFGTFPSDRNVGHGRTTTALPTAIPGIFDRVNAVTVRMVRGTLASSTEDAVLDGANALLIGDEIVQFVTRVLNSDGTETLSVLLRGRRGSEQATTGHLVADRVIILSDSTVLRVTLDASDLNTTHFYKGLTAGGALGASGAKSQKNTGASQKPLAPSISGTIASDDWTFTLRTRTRINQSWKDSVIAPLGEASEDYELDVLSGPGGTVKRKITTTASANGSVVTAATQTIFYDDADQIADFSSVQTTLSVVPYQISESVGRGFAVEATLVGG